MTVEAVVRVVERKTMCEPEAMWGRAFCKEQSVLMLIQIKVCEDELEPGSKDL